MFQIEVLEEHDTFFCLFLPCMVDTTERIHQRIYLILHVYARSEETDTEKESMYTL